MIYNAALSALGNIFEPKMRSIFWRILIATLAVVALIFILLYSTVLGAFIPWFEGWLLSFMEWSGILGMILSVLAFIVLSLLSAYVLAPATAIVAGLYLDDIADIVEEEHYPDDAPGQALPFMRSMVVTAKFLVIVVVANLFALLLLLVPGINIAAFFLVNGYIMGREFFEFAAMRHRSEKEAKQFRSRHSGTIFLAGMPIALFLSIPLLNVLTPLFAVSMMIHLHKALSAKDQQLNRQNKPAYGRA